MLPVFLTVTGTLTTFLLLSALNSLDNQKARLIDITADGRITDDELQDFAEIQHQLDNIDMTVEALRLWFKNTIAEGKINADKLKDLKAK